MSLHYCSAAFLHAAENVISVLKCSWMFVVVHLFNLFVCWNIRFQPSKLGHDFSVVIFNFSYFANYNIRMKRWKFVHWINFNWHIFINMKFWTSFSTLFHFAVIVQLSLIYICFEFLPLSVILACNMYIASFIVSCCRILELNYRSSEKGK